MRALALASTLLALALGGAGAAGADTFRVVSDAPADAALPNTVALALPDPPAEPQRPGFAELQGIWQAAGAAYGIPWTVLAAINQIETGLGANMGPSSAGAIGWMQFMPGTWLRWGTDGNGDGVADPWEPHDAIWSAARYLAAAGGGADLARAVFAYNHAQWYVEEVLRLANAYAGSAQVVANLKALERAADRAREDVLAAQAALDEARARERAAAGAAAAASRRAERSPLLSDRLSAQRRAVALDLRRERARAVARRRAADLERAEQALAAARDAVAAASFSPVARTVLGGASFDAAGYVFPVGGGPGLVSVGHDHHDYPAADIAAPAGAPVYALAEGVVESAWTGDALCGTGFTLRAADGRAWTYCHLGYLDPAVAAGTAVAAGAQVGLVGATGDATGPHLHLQLEPATSYPQAEPWFAGFAGSAFSWQDAPSPAAATPGTVFAVTPTFVRVDAPPPASTTPPPDATFAAPPPGTRGVVLFTRR